MHNGYYYAWVWDAAANNYVQVPEFDKLSNPNPQEKNRIRTSTHISAMEHEDSLWELKGKTLSKIREVSIRQCEIEDDKERFKCFEQVDVVYENGKPRETVKKITPEEAMEFNPVF